MEYHQIGKSGLKVSKFGLGTMSFGYPTEEKEAIKMIDIAFDQGINFIDTANRYPGIEPYLGRSEQIIGKALKGR